MELKVMKMENFSKYKINILFLKNEKFLLKYYILMKYKD